MDKLTRAAPGLSSFDPDARTVAAILATETPVKRRDYERGGFYNEVLVVSADAIDTSRMGSLPLLDAHRDFGVESRLGTVVPGSLRFESDRALVTIQLSRNEKAEQVFRDLSDQQTLSCSVGYRILQSERISGEDEIDTIRATKWQPVELSIVNIPADASATTRSYTGDNMPETNTTPAPERETRAAIDTKIREVAGTLGHADIGESAIRAGQSVEEFRTRLLDHLATEQEKTPTSGATRVDIGHGGHRTRAEAAADAMLARVNPGHQPQPDARDFIGLSLPEVARRCVEAAGIDTRGMSPGGIVDRGLHSTSDFPLILSNLANKRLQAGFGQVSSGLKRAARESSAPNFKAKTTLKMGEMPELRKVAEHGEFTRGTVAEAQESYKIETFGRIFGITRQALVGDDLNAFATAASRFGASAAVHEARSLVQLVESNPEMSDGKPVFHADHNNVASGALTLDNLAAARLLFRKQVGLSGDLVDLSPRYLIVPADLETEAEKLLSQIYATKVQDSTAAARNLELIVDPRLTSETAWYLAADPAQVDGLEYAYLEGQPGLYLESRAGFDVDGVEIKARLDWGCAFTEHRSWTYSPGT